MVDRVLKEVAIVLKGGRCFVQQPQRGPGREVSAAQDQRQGEP
jgi:hypothetical protein